MLVRGEYLAAWLVVVLTIALGFYRLCSSETKEETVITLDSARVVSLEEDTLEP